MRMALTNIVSAEDGPATSAWLCSTLRDALEALAQIQSTGDEALDRELLAAEQAIQRVLSAAQ